MDDFDVDGSDEEHDDHANCGFEGFRDAVAELLASFTSSDDMLGELSAHFKRDAGDQMQLWGSPLAAGASRKHFQAGDLRDVVVSKLSGVEPQKRMAISFGPTPFAGFGRKRRRIEVDYSSPGVKNEETEMVMEMATDVDDSDSDDDYEDEDERSEPGVEYDSDATMYED